MHTGLRPSDQSYFWEAPDPSFAPICAHQWWRPQVTSIILIRAWFECLLSLLWPNSCHGGWHLVNINWWFWSPQAYTGYSFIILYKSPYWPYAIGTTVEKEKRLPTTPMVALPSPNSTWSTAHRDPWPMHTSVGQTELEGRLRKPCLGSLTERSDLQGSQTIWDYRNPLRTGDWSLCSRAIRMGPDILDNQHTPLSWISTSIEPYGWRHDEVVSWSSQWGLI